MIQYIDLNSDEYDPFDDDYVSPPPVKESEVGDKKKTVGSFPSIDGDSEDDDFNFISGGRSPTSSIAQTEKNHENNEVSFSSRKVSKENYNSISNLEDRKLVNHEFNRVFNTGGASAKRESRKSKVYNSDRKQMKLGNWVRTRKNDSDSDDHLEDLVGGHQDKLLLEKIRKMEKVEKELEDFDREQELQLSLQAQDEELIGEALRRRCGKIGLTVRNIELLVRDILEDYRQNSFERNIDFDSDDKKVTCPAWGIRDIHIFHYLGDLFYIKQKNDGEGFLELNLSIDEEFWKFPQSRRMALYNGLPRKLSNELPEELASYLFDQLCYEQDEIILNNMLEILILNEKLKYQKEKNRLLEPQLSLYLINYLSILLGDMSGPDESGSTRFGRIFEAGCIDIADMKHLHEEVIPNFKLPTAKAIKAICLKISLLFHEVKNLLDISDFLSVLKIFLACSADANLEYMGIDAVSVPFVKLFECVLANEWHRNIQVILEHIFIFLPHYQARYRLVGYLKKAITTASPEVSQLIHNLYHQLCLAFFLNSTTNGYAPDDIHDSSWLSSKNELGRDGDIILSRHILPHLEKETLFHDGGELDYLNNTEVIREKSYEICFLVEALFHQLPHLICERTKINESVRNRQKAASYFQKGLERLQTRLVDDDLYVLFVSLELCYNFVQGSFSITIPIF